MPHLFEPIAIIGHACLLPGALNSLQFWENVLAKKDCLSDATKEFWRVDPEWVLQRTDLAWTKRSGIVHGFETIFDPKGYFLDEKFILTQDILVQWLLHTGREALQNARLALSEISSVRVGAILGNLSYSTASLEKYAESVRLEKNGFPATNRPHPANRFMSGLPIELMAKGLGLTETSYAIDAACASSLYAIKLACDQLHDRKADLMLSGAINASDGLILNVGFAKLQALSRSGYSRPLHQDADGLIPSQGVGIIVLKRLADAVRDNNVIQAVIRGIGLSNDGKSSGFLFPSQEGQVRAMQEAYATSGLRPEEISLIECHATGTQVGDSTEINSIKTLFGDHAQLTLNALKANIGHPITAAGVASIINVIHCFKTGLLPPSRCAAEKPTQALAKTNYKLLSATENWTLLKNKRIAAVNCFGFGGTNAHLLLEEWHNQSHSFYYSTESKISANDDIAIVGIGVLGPEVENLAQFSDFLFNSRNKTREFSKGQLGGIIQSIELEIMANRFPPVELEQTLAQQLAILKLAHDVCRQIKNIQSETTGVFIGLQCDTDPSPYVGPRISDLATQPDKNKIGEMTERYISHFTLSRSIGAMPNIAAARINQQFNFKKAAYSISAEEASGLIGLQIATRELRMHQANLILVGAVDLCCDIVHQTAVTEYLNEGHSAVPADAAVLLALKRKEDAEKDGDTIYAILPNNDEETQSSYHIDIKNSVITQNWGHSHAASGLLHFAAGVVACHEKKLPLGSDTPWLQTTGKRKAQVRVKSYLNEVTFTCQEA